MKSFETIIRDPDAIELVLTINPCSRPKLIPPILNDTYEFTSTVSSILEKRPVNPTDDINDPATAFHEHPVVAATPDDPEIPATPKLFLRPDFIDHLQTIFNDIIIYEAIHSFPDLTDPDRSIAITNHLTQLWQTMTF